MRKKIYDIIEIAGPDNQASLLYDRFMLVCIIGSIVPLCFKQTGPLFSWIDKITVAIFILSGYENIRHLGIRNPLIRS